MNSNEKREFDRNLCTDHKHHDNIQEKQTTVVCAAICSFFVTFRAFVAIPESMFSVSLNTD
jgi:hypothetical protein